MSAAASGSPKQMTADPFVRVQPIATRGLPRGWDSSEAAVRLYHEAAMMGSADAMYAAASS
jgi:hypothetical protein